MDPKNTRVSITINGPLHLGHLFLCKVNFHEAKRSGGKFFVHHDDLQPYWLQRIGSRAAVDKQIAENNRCLGWAGIKIAGARADSEIDQKVVHDLLRKVGLHRREKLTGDEEHDYLRAKLQDVGDPGTGWYPYCPLLTAAKVIQDATDGVTHVIRGREILTEFSLYAHLFRVYTDDRSPPPLQVFLPRLMDGIGHELSDVSKTRGRWKVRDLMQSMSPDVVDQLLRRSCLTDPDGEWTVDNVRQKPVLRERALQPA